MSLTVSIERLHRGAPLFELQLKHIAQAYVLGLTEENQSSTSSSWRQMKSDAAAVICAHFENMFSSPYATDSLGLFVASSSDGFAGYSLAALRPCIGETPGVIGCINGLFVHRPYRRLGLGQRLFDEAHLWLRQKGIDYIELQVNLGNEAGIGFWKKNGFNPVEQLMGKRI